MATNVIIAFNEIEKIFNLDFLYSVTSVTIDGKEYKLTYHKNPEMRFVYNKSLGKSEAIRNFDILIDCSNEPNLTFNKFNEDRLLHLSAEVKDLQRYLLNQAMEKTGCPHLRPIQQFSRTLGTYIPKEFSRLVMKTNHGARGIAQFLIDNERYSVTDRFSIFHDYIKELQERIVNEEEVPELENIEAHLKERFPFIIHYNSGNEKYKNESILRIGGMQDFVLEEFVPEVHKEYRLIVVNGEVVYTQLRSISGDVYKTATGSGEYYTEETDFESIFPEETRDEMVKSVMDVIRSVAPEISSFDLFITEDNKIGFFEYCPQFGQTAISHDRRYAIYEKFLTHVVKKYFLSRKVSASEEAVFDNDLNRKRES